MPFPTSSITILDKNPEAESLRQVLMLSDELTYDGDIEISYLPIDSRGIVIKLDKFGCGTIIETVRNLREKEKWAGGFIAIVNKDKENTLANMSLSLEQDYMKFGYTDGHLIVTRPLILTKLLEGIIQLKALGYEEYKDRLQRSSFLSGLQQSPDRAEIVSICNLLLKNPANHRLFPNILEIRATAENIDVDILIPKKKLINLLEGK